MKHLINRWLLPFLIWAFIAFIHFITRYLDTLKYRGEQTLNFSEFIFYLSVYSSWALFNIALYSALSKIAPYKSIRYFVYMFFVGLLIWLPAFFVLDAYLGIFFFDMEFRSITAVFNILSGQIIFFYAILYAVTFGVSTAIVYYQYSQQVLLATLELEKKHSESELRLTHLQMKALQSQLSPHFLFNCLGSISALARQDDKESVITAVARLGDLLRFTIKASQEEFILLADELEFVNNYIALQKLRFSERFNFSITQHKKDLNLLCPPFVLQPLVENAFIHSVAEAKQGDLINIKLTIDNKDNALIFHISNTLINRNHPSNGLGTSLTNLKERLDNLYGSSYSITHGQVNDCYVSNISIPVIDDE
ncbi:sensor histidine kinase [Pleionea sp. CnH1-48]|uniref:sensor histidine kinase n=1 Tax=Pleionea sp. CnH1-48 TaxID=2954494 RepID=UPI002096943C|nr:histidine kinase [Pleionea sp. CnH1-48]MCO7223151.1 histidine kinase [Pleionea sp. CnH1-48]